MRSDYHHPKKISVPHSQLSYRHNFGKLSNDSEKGNMLIYKWGRVLLNNLKLDEHVKL